MTIAEAIAKAAARLAAHRVEDARLDAETLLRHVLDVDRAWLVAHYPDKLDARALRAYDALLDRRAVREPLQYITGRQEFWGLDLIVTSDVLIPRPETEFVVEAALAAAEGARAPVILDLCTGSACIAVALAKELAEARVFAVDKSPEALDVARKNAAKHKTAERIRFLEGDLFEPVGELDLRGRVDVITANPPYIKSEELRTLQPEVRDFEPELALIAGPEGTEVADRIIRTAPVFLKKGGSLVMEMGLGQAEELRTAAEATGAYAGIHFVKDLAGIDRVITARRK